MARYARVGFDAAWQMAGELSDALPLGKLTEEERRTIVAHMRVRELERGEVLYHLGDPGDDVFVVHDGMVKSILRTVDGRERLIGLYEHGEFFGLFQVFARNPTRDSTAIAASEATVLQIAGADVRSVVTANSEAMSYLYSWMGTLHLRLAKSMATILSQDVPGRVSWLLLELARRRGNAVSMSQEEIADTIGASLRSVQAALSDLSRRGLIAVDKRLVRVLDLPRLDAELGEVLGMAEDALIQRLEIGPKSDN